MSTTQLPNMRQLSTAVYIPREVLLTHRSTAFASWELKLSTGREQQHSNFYKTLREPLSKWINAVNWYADSLLALGGDVQPTEIPSAVYAVWLLRLVNSEGSTSWFRQLSQQRRDHCSWRLERTNKWLSWLHTTCFGASGQTCAWRDLLLLLYCTNSSPTLT
jgi:hypothetical protein